MNEHGCVNLYSVCGGITKAKEDLCTDTGIDIGQSLLGGVLQGPAGRPGRLGTAGMLSWYKALGGCLCKQTLPRIVFHAHGKHIQQSLESEKVRSNVNQLFQTLLP